jgi:hypothetical protein
MNDMVDGLLEVFRLDHEDSQLCVVRTRGSASQCGKQPCACETTDGDFARVHVLGFLESLISGAP